jgi:hypothetical protein
MIATLRNRKNPPNSGAEHLKPVFFSLLLVSILLVWLSLPAFGQQASQQIVIEGLDTREFPNLSIDFSIPGGLDQQSSLTANQVSVVENDQTIAVEALTSEYVGVHFVLVINPERSLVLTYPSGYSNYDRMLAAVGELNSDVTPVTGDVYSLFINPDIHYDQLENYTEWKKALEGYKENQKQKIGSLQSLEIAVAQLTSQPVNKETVLVYMTPYIDPVEIPKLTALIQQAGKSGIRVHIWMTAATIVIGSAYEIDLQAVCETWGGSLTILDGIQMPPSPRDYMKNIGYRYTATWQSQIRSGTTQQISLRLTPSSGPVLISEVSSVDLEVLPTRLSFNNLPEELTINIRKDEAIEPAELPIQTLIEFPDGFPRNLLSTSLFVNGSLVQKREQAPFGDFVLDLSPYHGQDTIGLQLSAKDALGFETRSEMRTLSLIWGDSEANRQKTLLSSPWLWTGLSVVALGLLGMILLPPYLKNKTKKVENAQPAKPEPESSMPLKTFGSLIKLDRDNTPCAEKPLLLTNEISLIGKDPQMANLVLSDEALEPLHAEIHAFPDGRTRLTDFNTTAGTYVNFKAVDTKGVQIHHGDILHFGRLAFRFNSPNRITSPKN